MSAFAFVNRLRTALALQQPTGYWSNRFGWDAAKRITNITSQAGSFGYSYVLSLPSALVRKLALPNTAYITNTFDNVARLTGTYLKNSGNSVLDSYVYQNDPANERTNLTRADASTVAYSYDKIGQLKVANSSVNTEDRGYLYDAAWNLNWRTNNTTAKSFIVNPMNELTNGTAVGVMTYDGNGNLTNRGDLSYEYDDENRLTAVQQSGLDDFGMPYGWRTEFVYDGFGRLRRRDEFIPETGVRPARAAIAASNGSWYYDHSVEYIYDGLRVIQERNEANTPEVSYTRGRDLSGRLEGAGGIGGLLARSSADYPGTDWTNHAYYFADGNGNVTYMIDGSQSMVATYHYDPFGNTVSKSGTLADANVYRFSCKEIHVNSGMYYYLYRFYDPNLQRWINQDPLAELGGVNLYGFVANNALNSVDRDGDVGLVLAAIVCACTFVGGLAMEAWEDLHPEPAEPIFGEDDDRPNVAPDPSFHAPWWDNPELTPDWLKFNAGSTYPNGQNSECPPKNRWRRSRPGDMHDEWPTYDVPPRSRPTWVPKDQRPMEPKVPRNRPGREGRIEYDFIYVTPTKNIQQTAFMDQHEASFASICSFADHEIKFVQITANEQSFDSHDVDT